MALIRASSDLAHMQHFTYTTFTHCPDSGVEPGRWVRSVFGGGGGGGEGCSLTCVYSVIPLKEQTLQAGQNEQAQVRNFACYTWKSSIHCGGRPGFLFTHIKKVVSDLEPYNFGGAQKVGHTPQSGQVICVYTEGQKAGLTPQSEHCVNTV